MTSPPILLRQRGPALAATLATGPDGGGGSPILLSNLECRGLRATGKAPLSSDFAQHLSKSTGLAKALGNFGDLAQSQQFIRIKIDRFV